jgi:hypothetical protein
MPAFPVSSRPGARKRTGKDASLRPRAYVRELLRKPLHGAVSDRLELADR